MNTVREHIVLLIIYRIKNRINRMNDSYIYFDDN